MRHLQLQARGSSCLAGSLPAAMALLGELITTSRVTDLNRCRSLCGIPATTTRKNDLVEALLLHTRCPQNHWVGGTAFQSDGSWSGYRPPRLP